MNCNIYAWGNLEAGYSQFPTNYTQNIIKSIFSIFDNTIRDLCVTIRNEDLIYLIYGYQYKNDKSFGFCLEFNRVCPCNVNYIYSFFRAVINDILAKGKLLHYATSGEIQSDVSQLYEQSAVIEDYVDFILHNFNEEQANFQRIPPINRGTDYNSTAYALDESIATITNALRQHATLIFLPKKEDESINSYANVLKQLNKKNVELYEENNILRRQKNKIVWVLILLSIIFVSFIVFFIVMQSMNDRIIDLRKKNTQLKKHIELLQKDSTSLESHLNLTLLEKKSIEEMLQDSIKVIDNLKIEKSLINDSLRDQRLLIAKYPLLIQDIQIANVYDNGTIETNYGGSIYGKNSMRLKPKISYIGLDPKEIELFINWYYPNGNLATCTNCNCPPQYTQCEYLKIQEGANTFTTNAFGGKEKGSWNAGQHRIEIWFEGNKIAERTFTLY